jgi:hypothetical protein
VAQLLLSFVLLFYVPTLLFRFEALRKVDLARRKIANQIEDFFGAALPSVFLNAIAWVSLNTLLLWYPTEVTARLPLMLTGDAASVVRQNLQPLVWYYAALLAVAWLSGKIYGWVEYRLAYHGASVARNLPGEVWRWGLRIHDFWDVFFSAERVSIFPWIVRPTYVFVRTNENRLYHGRLDRYDRTSDGEVGGILLLEVSRFSQKTRDECIATDDDYIRPLQGSLYLKWSLITDINTADIDKPVTIRTVIAKFEVDRKRRRERRSLISRLRRLFAIY